ncbi:ABC transporter ATP-binding protein [Neptunitalea chrysea]|uniref:ABC transporter ATP-binding protein n=1 Tax=Neptunitalea chrysea TaxID=1647581 RepID=A0A9W6EU25_9FLAO|nr:ABC transporter ATP-binding protein [Neptunitalea chrysea]GLB52039.1 ABC transporter ATP-binding protein [Neptunitalea chrysea]
MSVILKAENISKQYRLGLVGTGTLSHDLNRWWYKVRGKEDPYLKIGDTNDRSKKGSSDYVWALKDINFEVKQGEVLGIIGKNGAGKSTLLKILSRVTSPTTGIIKTGGRIASLLEVGTGFHPELTGRENIYLNGAILGMSKAEITSKLDEIVAFSGCERYIDTPVKRYSSGMKVRLAFAVAAHLEPEILVVDEVLAVGDAEFQKKAIGKMQDISKGDGRTVLFVSHNMAAVKNLCTRGIILENGGVKFEGDIDSSVDVYLNDGGSKMKGELKRTDDKVNEKLFHFTGFQVENKYGEVISQVLSGDDIYIRMFYEAKEELVNVVGRIQIKNRLDEVICTLNNYHCDEPFKKISKKGSFLCYIPMIPFFEGQFKFDLSCLSNLNLLEHVVDAGVLNVHSGDFFKTGRIPKDKRGVLITNKWSNESKNESIH